MNNTGSVNLRKIKVVQMDEENKALKVRCPTDFLSPGLVESWSATWSMQLMPDVKHKYGGGKSVSDKDTGSYYGWC